MNKVIISGNLTADIEEKQTTTGKSVASFTLAVKRPMSKDTTDFIPCVAWESSAKYVSSYAHKGDSITLVGELHSREYEKDGKKIRVWEVDRCSEIEIKSKPSESISTHDAFVKAPVAEEPKFETLDDESDLPF